MIDNKLDERNTLLRINGKSSENLEDVVDRFYAIAHNVSALQLQAPEEVQFELLPDEVEREIEGEANEG